MGVDAFVIHIGDAVGGLVVLGARSRHLGAAPSRLTPAEAVARRLLAEHAAVEFGADAILVHLRLLPGRLPARQTVGCKFRQARTKAGIDIPVQHFGARVDVSVGIMARNPFLILPSCSVAPGSRGVRSSV